MLQTIGETGDPIGAPCTCRKNSSLRTKYVHLIDTSSSEVMSPGERLAFSSVSSFSNHYLIMVRALSTGTVVIKADTS